MKLLAFIYRRTVHFSHYCICNSLVIKINKLKKKKRKEEEEEVKMQITPLKLEGSWILYLKISKFRFYPLKLYSI